ncbi:MAG: TIGR00269 family protein [Candidatus Bathyarchaeota archaeon]|nr:MAG: TIGR00269 family protein [Candidatus Bathyarchaeota archaeon]
MSANIAASVCTMCKRKKSFFFRPYSGERLCKKCFSESIEAKVRASIAKYRMFNFHDKIAVAVSGGKDSISLLHILAKMERLHPKASLVAVTVDEGIEGYRDEALAIAAANCRKLRIDHHMVSFKELYNFTLDEIVARAQRKGERELTSCAYCGVLRRRALNITARDVGADKIATAHTLDDEVQTILLNIFRGDVLRLAREKPVTDEVHPRFVRRVKPFCEIPERESALYAYIKKIKFQDAPCPYASEALRNDLRAMLNRMEENHAGTKFTVFKSIERIRPALDEIAKKAPFTECIECGEPASSDLCRACELLRQNS